MVGLIIYKKTNFLERIMENKSIPTSLSVNGTEYDIISLLGKGKGGYSYLAKKAGDDRLLVLKQIHHEPCSYYQFGNKIEAERNDYNRLVDAGIPVPKMLDIDMKSERIVKEYIDGKTVDRLVIETDGNLGDEILSQARAMADLAKSRGLNIDYFPTNFILEGDKLYYIDYECNPYMDEWNFENWGIKYWSKTKEFCAHFIKS